MVKIRWNRVLVLMAVLIGFVAWPHLWNLAGRIEWPEICPLIFPWMEDHEELRSVLVVSVLLLGLTIAVAELRRE